MAASVDPGALPAGGGVQFVLDQGQPSEQTAYSMSEPFQATFTAAKGEHTLDASIVDAGRQVQSGPGDHDSATRIGIGDVIVAIGDSVTEGYDGTAYNVPPYTSWLEAPIGSADGRNYPQCGIGTGFSRDHWQEASHLVALGSALEQYTGYPVFILNEGVAGFTSGGYLARLSDPAWVARIRALHPDRWMIDLGINDDLQGIPRTTFQSNMQSIIDTLRTEFGADPAQITLALPSTGTGWQPYIDGLVSANGLDRGPDFSGFYANHASDSPALTSGVHPTVAGHTQMARLWALSLTHPRNVTVSETAPGTVTLSWDSLAPAEPTIAGYRVEYGTSPGVYTNTAIAGSQTSISIPDLSGRYYFAVVGYDNDPYASNLTGRSAEVSIVANGTPTGTLTLGKTNIGAAAAGGGNGFMAVAGPYTLGTAGPAASMTGYLAGAVRPRTPSGPSSTRTAAAPRARSSPPPSR